MVLIERRSCPAGCGLHRLIPDFLAPFKHYDIDIITGVLNGTITPETLAFEDYPCERTMERWQEWIVLNLVFINRQYNTSYAGEALVDGEPKYGAECLQLVWDCWVCAGFDIYRDNFSLGSNGVTAVDWDNVKPGDLIHLKKSVQTGTYTHYMLIVAVAGTKVTVIEQTAGASKIKSGDYYQVGTRCRTVDIDDANEYGKYSMRNAYEPYTWSGFDN